MYFEIALTVAIGGLVYFLLDYFKHLLSLSNYPPGPFPLPLIGNLHLLSTKPHEGFKRLSKRYGDVFSLSMGRERVVIVNSIEYAREALVQRGEDLAGRPTNLYTFNLVSKDGKDIAFADYGEMWKVFRKIAHNSLRMYGAGMERIGALVVKEMDHMDRFLNHNTEKAIDPAGLIGSSVMNIICAIVFGSRYDVNDAEFKEVAEFNALLTQGLTASDAVAYLPFLRFFPLEGLSKLKEAVKRRDAFMSMKLRMHMETYDANNIRDFTDAVIKHAEDERREGNKRGDWFTEEYVQMILTDIFLAGAETTATTLRWALVFLVHHPEKQEKAKEELKAVLGKNKAPLLSQRKELPYMEALIHETLRKSSLAPLGVPHKAVKDTSINGYRIPRETQVIFNVWGFHNDERHWKDPDVFLPERWLDENGHFEIGKHSSYLPFLAGRRVCLGESMAKAELFLFLSFLLHNYDILPASADNYPTLDGFLGITFSPKPFQVIFRKRDQIELC